MKSTKVIGAVELGRLKIKELEKEISNIEFSKRRRSIKVGNEIYYNELIPVEKDFNSKEDFLRYTFLDSEINNLKFLVEEVLHNTFFGEEQETIKDNYKNCYNEYMNGVSAALTSFIELFQ